MPLVQRNLPAGPLQTGPAGGALRQAGRLALRQRARRRAGQHALEDDPAHLRNPPRPRCRRRRRRVHHARDGTAGPGVRVTGRHHGLGRQARLTLAASRALVPLPRAGRSRPGGRRDLTPRPDRPARPAQPHAGVARPALSLSRYSARRPASRRDARASPVDL